MQKNPEENKLNQNIHAWLMGQRENKEAKNPEGNTLNQNIHAWLMGQKKPIGKKPGGKKNPIEYVYKIA